MNRTSHLVAALALTAAGAAFAQGNPPTTAPPNPATAAGQQNPVGGPMGTTGTTPQSNMAATPAPAPMRGTAMSQDPGSTSMAAAQPMRPARADRN